MHWRRKSLWRYASGSVVGGVCVVWAASLVPVLISGASVGFATTVPPGWLQYVVLCLWTALISGGLASLEHARHRRPSAARTAFRRGFCWGWLPGLWGALSILPFAQAVPSSWMATIVHVLVLTSVVGVSGYAAHPRHRWRSATWPAIWPAMSVGAILAFAWGVMTHHSPPQDTLGLQILCIGLWGGAVAWLLHDRPRRRARSWLRIVSTAGRDAFFPLPPAPVTLGSDPKNDICLPPARGVYPLHGCLSRRESPPSHPRRLPRGKGAGSSSANTNLAGYQLIDAQQPALVLINFRQPQVQTLKTGDLLHFGSLLLQYGEVQKNPSSPKQADAQGSAPDSQES